MPRIIEITKARTTTTHPASHSEDEAGPGCDDGALAGGLVPGHHVPEGDDGRADDDPHEEVHPSQVETHRIKGDLQDRGK